MIVLVFSELRQKSIRTFPVGTTFLGTRPKKEPKNIYKTEVPSVIGMYGVADMYGVRRAMGKRGKEEETS
jgi:hypothetical protein